MSGYSGAEPVTAPGIHDLPRQQVEPPLTTQQWKRFGDAFVYRILAHVLYALAGVEVLGTNPFGFLRSWADDLAAQADAAYTNAAVAQTSANYANSQLVMINGGNYASNVPGGVAITEHFTGASANDLGANWTRTSSGPGGGYFGPGGDGTAVWKKSGGNDRTHMDRHNTVLVTRHQVVMVLVAEPPQAPFNGGYAFTYLVGRCNADQDTYVYARLGHDELQVGCLVSDTQTSFGSVSVTPEQGDVWAFYLGTDIDDREFVVKRNSIEVWRDIDTDDVSQVDDATYLSAGIISLAADRSSFFDQTVPAALDVWIAADRLPASL